MKLFNKRRRSRIIGLAVGLMALSLVVTACGGTGGEGEAGGQDGGAAADRTITIGDIGWEEDVVVNALWKHILEERGYDVEVTTLGANAIYQGLAQDDLDLFLDAWLPNTHADKMDRFGNSLVKVSPWYQDATLTWTVPAYVGDVNSIADLQGKATMFDGRITGIEPSAGLSDISETEVIPQYNLGDSYDLKTSSTAAMVGALDRAIARQEPIVVTLWHPHIAYTRYDLKDLQDPRGALGGGEELWTLSRQGFAQDYPEINRWLKNFTLTQEQVNELEDLVYNKFGGPDKADAAIDQWAGENQDLINKWAGAASG
ncbi:MAG: glycine betaine ABC transporter substrate-binding protein [Candidatus Limnocylindria bacterium]